MNKKYTSKQIIDFIRQKKEPFWLKERERRALALFHKAAEGVPAYKDFLEKNRIQHEKVRTWQDFQLVPPVSKKHYLQQYPLEMLCWGGTLERPITFSATSGSTGEPFYFPRNEKLEFECSILSELFLRNVASDSGGGCLLINCLGMGVWIGGLITYKAFDMVAGRENYRLSIINPGVNKHEIFNALRKLAPKFKRVIICAYPPFLKDLIDNAAAEGIDLKKLTLRLLTAAEPFSEKFRDYLAEKTGLKNICLDSCNIYGTADMGAMAYELPAAILIRRLAVENGRLFSGLFSSSDKTPTLANYNPLFVTFEAPDGEILLTGDSVLPLVRHSVGDSGGVLSMGEISRITKDCGIDLQEEAERNGIREHLYSLPFVYVYERRDLSIKLYGATVYPEFVKEALIDEQAGRFVTGKFTMQVSYDDKQDQYLQINVEMKSGLEGTKLIEREIEGCVLKNLISKSSEYRNNYGSLGEKVVPRIVFLPYEHPDYFRPGSKQKWVRA